MNKHLHLHYADYVIRHKYFVFKAGRRLRVPLWQLLIHDWAKLTLAEWNPYVHSFYGVRTAEVKAAFDRAWLHHIHKSPHHWQHWLLQKDSGEKKPLQMPEKFVREMVADWCGAGRAKTGTWDISAWYQANKHALNLHPHTRGMVESLIVAWELDCA